MTTVTSATDSFSAINAANSAGGTVAPSAAQTASDSADRFLKLLVTQMKNQDPLNPMDNAQVTSQMAQISTVSGIEKLNTTVGGLNSQFMQMQALQGASLVGHNVTLQGNHLDIVSGTGVAGFGLVSAADNVQVEIVNPAGKTVETLQLGAQSAGMHGFSWDAKDVADGANYSFRVSANSGGTKLTPTPLMRDTVVAVSTDGSGLLLQTNYSGSVAYSDVKAFN
jgi:flagellar basal-body rod modification protein FlgD